MGYNRFSLTVILISLLIGLAGLAFVWVVINKYLIITKISLGGIWLLLLFFLIYYVQRTNRELRRFLENLSYLDTIKNLKEKDTSFKRLNNAFNKAIETVKQLRAELEAEHQYFKNTVEHIPVGLIVFEEDGNIQLINKVAAEMLQIQNAKHFIDLNTQHEKFGERLFHLSPGAGELLKIQVNSELLHLSVRSVLLKVKNKSIKLVSIQNIQSEIEEGELEAWQKLIRVMTHEIMNSVSPVKSLTFSMQRMLMNEYEKKRDSLIKDNTLEKTLSGLKAIEKRSKGLLSFVQNYKDLTALPFPDFREWKILDMFKEIESIFHEELLSSNIIWKMDVIPRGLKLKADYKLITQVLINLVQNAIYALVDRDDKELGISASKNKDEQILIRVSDNGKGIPSDMIEKIFIPFYTTRKDGSGIGLAFARQIMQMHKGRIFVQSEEDRYTVFTLVF